MPDVSVTQQTEIDRLRAIWRGAADAVNGNASSHAVHIEQEAWDAYADACHGIDQCLHPDCRETDSENSYCPDHR